MTGVPDPRQGRVLALCPLGLGSFLMATPALRVLSRELGRERLSALVLKQSTGSMAEGSGLFRRTFMFDPDSEGVLGALAGLREIRRERSTHSLALYPSANAKAAVFHRLVGAGFRMGFDYPNQPAARRVQHRSVPLQPGHDVEQNLRLVEAFLGAPVADAGGPFFPLPLEYPEGLPDEAYFACHPGSSIERGMVEKRLSPEAFAALIGRVFAETGWRCVLVGGPEEAGLRDEVAAKCREAVVDVPTGSLEQTAGVLRRARFLLANDSGLMHLAAAVGTRCAAFFGPTDERRTGPYGYWEDVAGAPRHLILRRPGTEPYWTQATLGRNPRMDPAMRTKWELDVPEAWERMRAWIAALGPVAADGDAV